MNVIHHSDPNTFERAVLPLLLAREAECSLILGIIRTLIDDPERYPRYYLLEIPGEGVAVMTPPYGVLLTALSGRALDRVVSEVRRLADVPPSVAGPRATALAFRDRWPVPAAAVIEQGLYQLDTLTPPPPVPGTARVAGAADRDLLLAWNEAFLVDCGLHHETSQAARLADAAIRARSRWLWEVDGRAVSMAGKAGDTPNGARIAWVYTPRAERGRGYAAAVTAAVTGAELAAGKRFCFLYTDLANPTSNGIYRRLGYTQIDTHAHVTFQRPA